MMFTSKLVFVCRDDEPDAVKYGQCKYFCLRNLVKENEARRRRWRSIRSDGTPGVVQEGVG